jgi:hypothetical protein
MWSRGVARPEVHPCLPCNQAKLFTPDQIKSSKILPINSYSISNMIFFFTANPESNGK